MSRGPDNTLPVQNHVRGPFTTTTCLLDNPSASSTESSSVLPCAVGATRSSLPARPKVTVPLLYGDTTSVLSYLSAGRNSLGVGEAHCGGSTWVEYLVEPINNSCSEVEWCQVPIVEVNSSSRRSLPGESQDDESGESRAPPAIVHWPPRPSTGCGLRAPETGGFKYRHPFPAPPRTDT